MRQLFVILIALGIWMPVNAKQITFTKKGIIHYHVSGQDVPVVQTALNLFEADLNSVLEAKLIQGDLSSSQLVIRTLAPDSKDVLAGKLQSFRVEEIDGKLYVTGADSQGTAYGIMELSRLLGVSPWVWWADSTPVPLEKWVIANGFRAEQTPAIPYRGIFINDEDNGFCPWSWKTFDPSAVKGRVGPKTHEKVFELMLRLRANVFWPAMHNCSVPFFLTPGNQEMADRFGIIIGTSHCEPMLRNTNGEWKKHGVGEYNYVTNRENVYRFWEDRVRETANSNGFYTIGMRGVHDTGMEGVEGIEQQRTVLQQVINDQRGLIEKYVNKDAARVPQVFIPYKEVLPVYHAGLNIPEDVTLMWCDDNYGYIRHLPDSTERQRKGGNGVYYHFSYWGRPQTHVWLPSTCPSLVQTELERAYRHGIRKLWVFNVGDIKTVEYLTEYGLEMAWNEEVLMNRNANEFAEQWLKREFGDKLGRKLLPVWNMYYDLAYQRRAEFLGNTRVEEQERKYKFVSDLPWSDEEVQAWLDRCIQMEAEVISLRDKVDEAHRAHWFELVEYPCLSFTAMARKMLVGQLARHGKAKWDESLRGHKEIFLLTDEYHQLLDGKWNRMMGFWGGHSMYREVDTTQSCPSVRTLKKLYTLTAKDGNLGARSYIVDGLGYSNCALAFEKGDSFQTKIPSSADSLHVTFAFVPNHPVDADKLEAVIEIEGEQPQSIQYETYGRSEEWKQNIERNQALRTIMLPPSEKRRKMRITATTPAVILDEIYLSATQTEDWKVYIAPYKGDKACAISYTFDDGLSEQYSLVAPQFEKRGFRGTFAINGSKINSDGGLTTDTTRMSWSQVKDLSDRGHEISNHGWKHKNFARFPLEEIREDIYKNDSAIFANTGVMPRTFVYPNNNKKEEAKKIAVQNRVGTRTKQRSIGSKSTPQNLEAWVNTLIETNDWGVGMTHGLTYGYDAFRDPQRFWDHLDQVKAKEDKIWVGTFREVAAYVEERGATQLDIVYEKNHLRITPGLTLDKELFIEPLTLVIKGKQIKKISVRQDGKRLPVQLHTDKAVFDFNPYGGVIEVNLK